jgi:hypothetical protein
MATGGSRQNEKLNTKFDSQQQVWQCVWRVPFTLARIYAHSNTICVTVTCGEFDELSNCQLLKRWRVHGTDLLTN